MELDLDALLQSQTNSDEEDINKKIHHRTVDEILNDSDSSSSSDYSLLSGRSSNSLPKVPNQIPSQHASTQNSQFPVIEEETLELSEPHEKSEERRSSFLNRRLSGQYSDTSIGRSYSRPLPPLFGGIKPNPKPGAALVAAAVTWRLVPSPHAAAIKFRRASVVQNMLSSQESTPSVRDFDLAIVEDLGSDNFLSSGVRSEIAQLDGKLAVEDDQVEVPPSPEVELVSGECRNEEILGGDEAAEIARDGDEFCSGDETQIEHVESVSADRVEFGTVMDLKSSASIAFEERQISSGNEKAYQVDANSTISGSVDVVEENAVPSSAENENDFKVDDNSKAR